MRTVSACLLAVGVLVVASAVAGCGSAHRAVVDRAPYSLSKVKAAFAAEGIQLSKYGGHVQPPRGIVYLVNGMGISVTVWIGHRRPANYVMRDSGWGLGHQGNLTLGWDPSLNRRVRAALRRLA